MAKYDVLIVLDKPASDEALNHAEFAPEENSRDGWTRAAGSQHRRL